MNAPLTKDTLCEAPDTSLWRLYLRLRPDALEALLTGPEASGSPSFTVGSACPRRSKATAPRWKRPSTTTHCCLATSHPSA